MRTNELTVALCDRCAEICDEGCRRAALRERVLLQRLGMRV